MATYRVRDCLHCGNKFTPNASHTKHCCPECRFRDIASKFTSAADCWNWPMSSNKQTGYGQFTLKPAPGQILATAHRLSYALFVGAIPEGMCVMHKCDNRRCFNPEHLAVGTLNDNNQDMLAKGRAAWQKSVKVPKHKVTNWETRLLKHGVEGVIASAKKSWETRRLRYGDDGIAKTASAAWEKRRAANKPATP